jgi:hypothetical protein
VSRDLIFAPFERGAYSSSPLDGLGLQSRDNMRVRDAIRGLPFDVAGQRFGSFEWTSDLSGWA